MSNDNQFLNPALEQAVSEIRQDDVSPAVVEAAAARVWARLQAVQAESAPDRFIRNCEEFQALLPEYRARKLSPARAMLVEDHLHQCVACRHVYEGRAPRVVEMATPKPRQAMPRYTVRWAAAAVVVVAAGLSVWVFESRTDAGSGRAIVQAVNGALFEVSASGIRPLAAGQDLPDGVEIRTAPSTDAMLQLRDGSIVEMRERSGISTQNSAKDLTIQLTRGSVIVQAAKRSSGHLYVVTSQCRVAVTGTVFGVTSGVKGSRVSVLQGEVHVTQENQEKVLHPGDQTVSGEGLQPESVRDDISWSRNREKYFALLASLRDSISSLHLPDVRYSSNLIARLPASTVLYASIPNMGDYLGSAESVFRRKLAENDGAADILRQNSEVLALIDKLRLASSYLGDEVVVTMAHGPKGGGAPVFFAELKREGFDDFLQKSGVPVVSLSRNGFVVFGPMRAAVETLAPAMDSPQGGFQNTPFYHRIDQAYQQGAGLLLCVDLSAAATPQAIAGARYLIAEQKEVSHKMEARATLAFDKERAGLAAWLDAPASMGSLQYFTPETAFATAFVTRNSGAIVDQLGGVLKHFGGTTLDAQTGTVRDDLAASVGGEFGLALDGPALPTPSWKLVVEVYDPARFQTALQKLMDVYNAQAAKNGGKPLRTDQKNVDGRTYYMIAGGDPNPLTEAHYTFADGYMIAAPSIALLTKSLEARRSRISLDRSAQFISLAPRDHYANFSGVVYQNLAPTVGPIAGLLQGLIPSGVRGGNEILKGLSQAKPMLIAAYGEPDQLTVATASDVLGGGLTDMMTGNVAGMVGSMAPLPQFRSRR